MSVITIDREKYSSLLAEALPVVIQTKEANERYLKLIQELARKRSDRTPEETALYKLLATLVRDYESRKYPAQKESPLDMLKFLIEENGLTQSALVPIFGSRGAVSNVMSGRRQISKAVAKKLAERFRVSPDLFL